ncbi:TonB-dependent receptor [Pseudomaricurvus alkylphenolicus]|uniref:TonB-dependent receptor n=1 Tax=Pseudomaricurvus alkylphenolicus TaxID=1306991 RepID=UPI00141DC02D|nr:TonB-dependent receptor [Pseudomaricurvus alkylphenolicus]NIB38715.1 TonB-dependent receptor [Pseudomaricurvus alkylphenolicus]
MKYPLILSVLSASIMVATQSHALQIEEIVVTAQKREQSLQDVSMSINVVSGEFIEDQNLTELQSLSQTTPNVTIAEAGSSQSIYIRGIGSGQNAGFEQSVATFSDGIYFSRGGASRAQFLDIERIEVLRGPQGILFGNSAIAGALNIVTRNPSQELEGFVSGFYDDKYGEKKLEAGISIPINDSLAIRLVGSTAEADGFLTNEVTGEDEVQEDNKAARMTVLWEPNDEFQLIYKLTHSQYDVEGEPIEANEIDYVKQADGQPAPWNSDMFGAWNGPSDPLPSWYTDIYQDLGADVHSLQLKWDVAGHTITSVSGYIDSESSESIDPDQSPYAIVGVRQGEKFTQWSQEVRIDSPQEQNLEYTAGLYYQEIDLDLSTQVGYNIGFPHPMLGNTILQGVDSRFVNQKTTTQGAFGKLTYHLTQALRGSLGVRWSEIEKEVDAVLNLTELDDVRTLDPIATGIMNGRGIFADSLDETRTYTDTTVDFVLEWDVTADIMLYGRYAQGFKAGGYNSAYQFNPEAPTPFFEPETVDSYELGIKSKLLDGAMVLNAALFRSEYSDMQVSNLVGLGFVTSNAAESVTQGLEVEVNWQLAESLRMDLNVAYLDAEFEKYDTATCTEDQKIISGLGNNCTQDLSGREMLFSPEYSGRLSFNYSPNLFENFIVDLNLGMNFTDSYYSAQDLDPNAVHNGYEKFDARVALSSESGSWVIALIGTNLTDKKTFATADDLPNTPGSYVKTPESPRTFGLQARYSW